MPNKATSKKIGTCEKKTGSQARGEFKTVG